MAVSSSTDVGIELLAVACVCIGVYAYRVGADAGVAAVSAYRGPEWVRGGCRHELQ